MRGHFTAGFLVYVLAVVAFLLCSHPTWAKPVSPQPEDEGKTCWDPETPQLGTGKVKCGLLWGRCACCFDNGQCNYGESECPDCKQVSEASDSVVQPTDPGDHHFFFSGEFMNGAANRTVVTDSVKESDSGIAIPSFNPARLTLQPTGELPYDCESDEFVCTCDPSPTRNDCSDLKASGHCDSSVYFVCNPDSLQCAGACDKKSSSQD